MKTLIAIFCLLSTSAFATVPDNITKVANQAQSANVRTQLTEVTNSNGQNPCLPDGVSYQADLQVRQADVNGQTNQVVYSWETVKTYNIDKNGKITETCSE